MNEKELLARVAIALASNPNVFDPNLAHKYEMDFHSLLGAGAVYSAQDAMKIQKKLSEENFVVKRLWECAKDIVEYGKELVV